MSERIVAIVDDDEAVLASLVSMLTIEGYRAVGFSTAESFLVQVTSLSPSCIITDIRMPWMDGLTMMERLRASGMGHVPVVVVSGHADVPIAVSAMQMGALTVLEKPFSPGRLLEIVALAVERVVPRAPSPELELIRRRLDSLSPREREVLPHLLRGSSSKVTAIALEISPRTIDIFRANILRKMQVVNVAALGTLLSSAGCLPI